MFKCKGTVAKYLPPTDSSEVDLWAIHYDDGDSEHLDRAELLGAINFHGDPRSSADVPINAITSSTRATASLPAVSSPTSVLDFDESTVRDNVQRKRTEPVVHADTSRRRVLRSGSSLG